MQTYQNPADVYPNDRTVRHHILSSHGMDINQNLKDWLYGSSIYFHHNEIHLGRMTEIIGEVLLSLVSQKKVKRAMRDMPPLSGKTIPLQKVIDRFPEWKHKIANRALEYMLATYGIPASVTQKFGINISVAPDVLAKAQTLLRESGPTNWTVGSKPYFRGKISDLSIPIEIIPDLWAGYVWSFADASERSVGRTADEWLATGLTLMWLRSPYPDVFGELESFLMNSLVMKQFSTVPLALVEAPLPRWPANHTHPAQRVVWEDERGQIFRIAEDGSYADVLDHHVQPGHRVRLAHMASQEAIAWNDIFTSYGIIKLFPEQFIGKDTSLSVMSMNEWIYKNVSPSLIHKIDGENASKYPFYTLPGGGYYPLYIQMCIEKGVVYFRGASASSKVLGELSHVGFNVLKHAILNAIASA